MAGGRIDILIHPDTKAFPGKLESGLKGTSGIAGKIGKGIALALAAGTAAAGFGLGAIIEKGKAYEANLNELQAVTQATGLEMRKVGQVAKDLGADMSLPATSAADASAAMVELAKGGLSLDQAMKAAKGTLQLAAAAQIDGAQAAEIQSNSLNAFRLNADQAGRVADVLANTANAAAGSIVDIGNSMKFVAPVSAALGVSIEDTAAAIGLLANQGIKGEQAGTSLRGILASLASPSKAAKKALEQLGIAAFDQQGKFIGLRAFTDQLAKAKGRLSDAEFAAATSTAFGNEGLSAANALAAEGAAKFDEMSKAVSRAGGAADVAGAKTKGLGGAIEGFKSQVETAGIGIFEAIAPPLEKAVRAGADAISNLTPAVVQGIETAIAAGELFGPRLADALRDRGQVVAEAVGDVLGPIAETIPDLLNAGINVAIDLWDDFTAVLANVVDAAKPVANGIAAVVRAAMEADGPISAIGAGLRIVGDVASGLSGVLVPIGKAIGAIAQAFADLPGPIQTAIIALGLIAAFRGPLSSLGDTITSRVTGPFRAMGQEIKLQQALLTGSTDIMSSQVGKFGLAMAALEARIPVMQKMRSSFEEAAAGADRFQRAAGLAAAAGTGIKTAATGIVGALGGPWGLAITGAALALSVLAGRQQEAARKAAEHAGWIDQLAKALDGTEGAVDSNIRSMVSKKAQDEGALDRAKQLGIAYEDVTRAILEQGPALDGLRSRLQQIVEANTEITASEGGPIESLNETGRNAKDLLGIVDRLAGGFATAQEKQRQLDEAIRKGNVSMLDATGSGRTLSGAMEVLRDSTASADDRARALKEALDALSGGQVSLEAAQARLNEQLARLSEAFGENVDKAKGWGAELLNADGSINTTTENGRRLFSSLQEIAGSMAEVAQRTFDTARAQGDDLPVALDKARLSAQAARDEFVKQHIQMGLTEQQAIALADRYGLIPSQVATLITAPGMTPTQLELINLKALVDKVPGDKPITVRSLSDEAKQKLIDLGITVRTLPNGDVEIIAKDEAARRRFEDFIRDTSNRTVTVRVTTHFSSTGIGGAQFREAKGGILAAAYAQGGVHRKLTPMRAGLAQIVPPNTWRIVGDRLVDDEAYIPINHSARSRALLLETARRMGFDVIRRFALGGIAGQSTTAVAPQSLNGLTISGRLQLDTNGFVSLVDARIHENNRQVRRAALSGTGGAR